MSEAVSTTLKVFMENTDLGSDAGHSMGRSLDDLRLKIPTQLVKSLVLGIVVFDV